VQRKLDFYTVPTMNVYGDKYTGFGMEASTISRVRHYVHDLLSTVRVPA